jgi:hypothetical protein
MATAVAARAALEAATIAERTAEETAEAARLASAAAGGDLLAKQQGERLAVAAEESAKESYQRAEEVAREKPSGG